MARFRPRSLYAYASAAHLLASANQGRPPLSQPLAAAFLAAEPVQQSYRSSIADVFGCPAVGEYGSIECGMIAYEHPSSGYRIFERSVIVETEKNQNGYQILVTQLRDTGFPLFRYEIGDLTPEPLHSCPDGFDTINAIKGRSHDLLQTPSGSVFHGEMITHILERIPEVVLFSIHQDREFRLHIQVKTIEGKMLPAGCVERIRMSLFEALHEDMDIVVSIVHTLDRSMAGKHRWITSDIGQNQGFHRPAY
jgi:phenylacetate-coenzyme A ligase PaaK-like adenylate-forming protein